MRSFYIISLVTFTSACQVENAIEKLPIEGGDLVMLSLNPFPSQESNSSVDVSSFILSQDAVPRWEFIESRTSNSNRIQTRQNSSGGFVLDISETVQEILIWYVPFASLKSLDILEHRPIFRLRGDPAPDLVQHIYRCYTSRTTCSESSKGIGPLDGTSCTLDKFGTALYFKRTGETWEESELPETGITLRDYALETAAPKNDGNQTCEQKSAWDY